MINIRLHKLHSGEKKFKVEIPVGHKTRTVYFGQRGASDYTIHKDPLRMEQYVRRHGGKPTRFVQPDKVHEIMLSRKKSTKEKWDDMYTPGYWSRWLLWSQPSLRGAIKYMEASVLPKRYKIVLRSDKN
mgnify:CR=1 FL=1